MRTNDILINENSSPYMKRLVLMKRAGIKLNCKQKKRLEESVSQVLPPLKSERDRVQSSMMKQFKDIEEDDELELELMDDEDSDEDSELLDSILREMGYGEDDEEEYEPTIDMEDIPELTDEELELVIKELEYTMGE
tara:strand:+ start:196 stop:606 length:411 start_codon:yes stop_codon:yes gene_type:complete